MKNDQELAVDVDQGILQGHPHWDPILKGSKPTKLAFLQHLHCDGLLTLRKKAQCRVGCFHVKKKGSMHRLVQQHVQATTALPPPGTVGPCPAPLGSELRRLI